MGLDMSPDIKHQLEDKSNKQNIQKVHTLLFYSNTDKKDTNNENGVEDTHERNFTTWILSNPSQPR